MKVEPVSVGFGFLLAFALLQAKKFMDGRKEGFACCGAAA